jgi:hypothetical protein
VHASLSLSCRPAKKKGRSLASGGDLPRPRAAVSINPIGNRSFRQTAEEIAPRPRS